MTKQTFTVSKCYSSSESEEKPVISVLKTIDLRRSTTDRRSSRSSRPSRPDRTFETPDKNVILDKPWMLLQFPMFKLWIRYFNKESGEMRTGGLLTRVDPSLKYIVVYRPGCKRSWYVSLERNILFINKNSLIKETKVAKLKEKLFQLYKQGRIAITPEKSAKK